MAWLLLRDREISGMVVDPFLDPWRDLHSAECVHVGAQWLHSGGCKFLGLFIGSGVLAIYFHLFSIVAVAAPFLAALLLHVRTRLPGKLRATAFGPPLRHWISAGLIVASLSALLVLP